MKRICIIHYGEIGLKGRNRDHFEKILIFNIRNSLKDIPVSVKRVYGRILLTFENVAPGSSTPGEDQPQAEDRAESYLKERLKYVFGIENFAFGYHTGQEIDEMGAAAVKLLQEIVEWQTFGVKTKRSDQKFPIKSVEVNKRVGAAVLEKFPDKKVNLTDPDHWIHVEIVDKSAYVVGNKIRGPGGLPVGVSGKVLCMLSGGIDSPVAAWYMMKRGCRVDFIHFHSMPYVDKASVEKVKELAQLLKKWQGDSKIISVPFAQIQKRIVTDTKAPYRVVLYRRIMFKIAEQFALRLKAKALITGEAVGQVASQTLENIQVVSDAVEIPVLRPLIGMDKQEIMDKAMLVGTYDLSILPHGDCCSLFIPKYPVTKASIQTAREQEGKIDVENLMQDAINRAEQESFVSRDRQSV